MSDCPFCDSCLDGRVRSKERAKRVLHLKRGKQEFRDATNEDENSVYSVDGENKGQEGKKGRYAIERIIPVLFCALVEKEYLLLEDTEREEATVPELKNA
jgi:hypothetical protein